MSKVQEKVPNSLIHETSPYLLQHAYNPVNWFPFNENAFEKAKNENKPVLISIGYSACHWCHVMEHESFEDKEVAELMNKYFVNIKVDREERSDVDMIYMQAVQLMTGQGGWPLNCFVLPDGRPFYGGTYFQKNQWMNVLKNLAEIYTNDPDKVNEYAEQLLNGIKQAELVNISNKSGLKLDRAILTDSVARWKSRMDNVEGGPNHAPKFPLPNNYRFLLRYTMLEKDKELLDHVELTLTKMAFGGIYDQLHGGFARYSTDMLWKVPHFEKMLYDNAQLVSLYCEAYTITKNELYKEVVIETLDFVRDEWYKSEGAFYSAYDADSDGEEGKYYVWNKADLEDLLGEDFKLFASYYEINDKGYWEHGNYILMRSFNITGTMMQFDLNRKQLHEKINNCKAILKQEVKSRIKPGLDDKSITSWNAMMCSAFAKAYLSLNDENYKKIALSSINFILKSLSMPDGKLYRTYKNGESKIDGFLDDYAFAIEALINCYIISQDEKYLLKAKSMCEFVLKEFHNPASVFLYYAGNSSQSLVTKTSEINDNVIPASNSQMAINFFQLGTYFDDTSLTERAAQMLGKVLEELKHYGSGYSNWGCLALNLVYPFKEVAVVGNNVNEKLLELNKHDLTNTILAVHANASDLPLVKNRYVEGKTLFYVCQNKACKLPVTSVEETVKQLV
jgi:uncharacterized protein YyaL (SSP411 family)